MNAKVSIVIPTLNEESVLADLLDNLKDAGAHEIVVADGGSVDGTASIAQAHGVRWIPSPCGRATQMNTGAAVATGDVLMFLHADVLLEAGALAELDSAVSDPSVIGGNFDTFFGGDDWVAATFNWIYRARLPLGIFYGDSGIWVRKGVFEALGRYREWPIMEDYECGRRIFKAGKLAHLKKRIFVSPRRWKHGGLLHALTVWVLIQSGYTLGVHPRRLAWLYRHIR